MVYPVFGGGVNDRSMYARSPAGRYMVIGRVGATMEYRGAKKASL